ncbi:MAG TPA: metallophosphoesterase [Abditibacteriaceae bacterium]|jgi:3',5'-cyclic AMP phosphodiesterase CpdA
MPDFFAAPYQIVVPQLKKRTRVLHITDAHFCRADDDGNEEHNAICRTRHARWQERENQEANTSRLLQDVKESGSDLLWLTGDIVDFPARASLQRVRELLDNCGVPWLYVPGNHDWYFPYQQSNEALRRAQYEKLAPLFNGGPQLCWKHEINGLQILGVDNSTYQIEGEQLQFAREALQTGLPTVLLVHVPLTQPGLRAPTIAKWRDCILVGEHITEERRADWAWAPDRPETAQFIELMQSAPNLIAILCGHVHFAHEEAFGSAVQLVGAPAFAGGSRIIDFTCEPE